ncbi:hypothetical protein ACVNIS_01045 [Sphaerotilaceae bacterium SBD11-9]
MGSFVSRAIVLLATEKGRTFPETGLVVLRESHAVVMRERSAETPRSRRDIDVERTYQHEATHFLQAITCGYLWDHSLRYFDACTQVLNDGCVPSAHSRAIIETYRESTWARAHEPGQRVDVRDTRDSVLLIPVAPEHTLSVADLLEGVADLVAFQNTTSGATAADYMDELAARYGGMAGATYWNAFSYVAHELDVELAYRCFCPLAFVALNTADPPSTFIAVVGAAKELGAKLPQACSDLSTLFKLAGDVSVQNHFACKLAQMPAAMRHPTLMPCLEHALQFMSAEALLQYAANPATLSEAPDAHLQALHPPVIVMSSDAHGKVVTLFNGRAREDRNFGSQIIQLTAACGAAERLLFPTQSRYQFCPHSGCEHHEAALCFRYYTPPSIERGQEHCQFPKLFATLAHASPKQAWEAIGFQVKSLNEVVAEFEATGEAGLLALVKRQKASIVRWLGHDAYRDLEWKCDATAQKALRAMQTNKMQDVIEAAAFRDAVVREVVQRADASRTGAAGNGG